MDKTFPLPGVDRMEERQASCWKKEPWASCSSLDAMNLLQMASIFWTEVDCKWQLTNCESLFSLGLSVFIWKMISKEYRITAEQCPGALVKVRFSTWDQVILTHSWTHWIKGVWILISHIFSMLISGSSSSTRMCSVSLGKRPDVSISTYDRITFWKY